MTENFIEIDIQNLYQLHSEKAAGEILKSILENYKVRILYIAGYGDPGEYKVVENKEIEKELELIEMELFEKYNFIDPDPEEVFKEYLKRHKDQYVIVLYDGYEEAYAIVLPQK